MPDDIDYAIDSSVEDSSQITLYAVKQHDDDVIFSRESLEEFIRLIQRQGINNLTVYSVSDLLAGNPPKYQTLTARFPPPTFETPPQEFEFNELKDRKGYFVFVRYSFCWEGDEHNGEGPVGKIGIINDRKFTEIPNGEYHSLNEINGRHVFVKTINDIKFYKKYINDDEEQGLNTTESSVFHEQVSDENPIPDIVGDNGDYMKNGTFTITVDNIQYVIKIKGFNDDGEYIGKVKVDPETNELGSDGQPLVSNTDGYVLRGDGAWANAIDNDWLPVENNKSSLGSNTQAWKNLYISSSVVPTPDPDGKQILGYCSEGDLNSYTTNPSGNQYDDNGQHYDLTDAQKDALSSEPTEGKTIVIYKDNIIGYCGSSDLEDYTQDDDGPQYDDDGQHYSLTNEEIADLAPEPTEGKLIIIYKENLLGYCGEDDLENYTQDDDGPQYDDDGQHYSLTNEEIGDLASTPIPEDKLIIIYKKNLLGYCSADDLASYTQDNNGTQYDDSDQHYSLTSEEIEDLVSEPTAEKDIPIYENIIAGYCSESDLNGFTVDADGDYFDSDDNHYDLSASDVAGLSSTPVTEKTIPIYETIVAGYCSEEDLGNFTEDSDGDYFDNNNNHYDLTAVEIADLSSVPLEPKTIPIYEAIVAGYCSESDLGDFTEDPEGEYFDDDNNRYDLTSEEIADLSPTLIAPKDIPIYEDDNQATLGTPDQPWDALYVTNVTAEGDTNIAGDLIIGGTLLGYCSDSELAGYTQDANGNQYDDDGQHYNLTSSQINALSPKPTDIRHNAIYGPATPSSNLIINGKSIETNALPTSNGTTGQFWRGGISGTLVNPAGWSNALEGKLYVYSATGASGNTIPDGDSNSDFYCSGAGYFARNLAANKVFKAVFNDYAEYRSTIDLKPGHVVIDNDDGSLSCANARLLPGAQVISDTFGDAMGYTKQCQTPLAVAGRVLVYTYQPRENYHAGMAVCSAPDGTVDIMTREEIKEYPDCIIGIVSEIPEYERWGTDQVEVNGRIWIKVK